MGSAQLGQMDGIIRVAIANPQPHLIRPNHRMTMQMPMRLQKQIQEFDRSTLKPPDNKEAIELGFVEANLKERGVSLAKLPPTERLRTLRDVWSEQPEFREPWNSENFFWALSLPLQTVVGGPELAEVQLLINRWKSYFKKFNVAVKAANKKVCGTINAYNARKVAERERMIKMATSFVGIALSSFGAAPIVNIIGAELSKFMIATGVSAFGEQPTWSLIAGSINQGASNVGYGISGRNDGGPLLNVLENAGREGVAAMGKGCATKLGEMGIDSITNKIKNKLKVSQNPTNDAGFEAMLDAIDKMFEELEADILNSYLDISSYFRGQDISRQIIRGVALLNSKPSRVLYGEELKGRLVQLVSELRKEAMADLLRVFACPVVNPGTVEFNPIEVERLMWALYFQMYKTEFMKKDKALTDKNAVSAQLGNEIGKRLSELKIAEARDHYIFKKIAGNNTIAREETLAKEGTIVIGKHSSGHQSMRNAVIWAENIQGRKELDRLLNIDVNARDKIRDAVKKLPCLKDILNPKMRAVFNTVTGQTIYQEVKP